MSIKQFYKIQNKIVSRSWRHKPTYPVLPSWETEFVCIKGIIERIDLEEEYNYFEFVPKSELKNRIINTYIDALFPEYNFQKLRKHFLAKEVNRFLIKVSLVNVQIDSVIYRSWVSDW